MYRPNMINMVTTGNMVNMDRITVRVRTMVDQEEMDDRANGNANIVSLFFLVLVLVLALSFMLLFLKMIYT